MPEYNVKLPEHAIVEMGRRNWNVPHHWELLDMDNYQIADDKAVVFCWNGNGGINNKYASGFAKYVENYLDLLFKGKEGKRPSDYIDIVSFKYARSNERKQTGSLTQLAVEQIVNFIISTFKDKSGNRLDLDTAKKNMSRFTFFSYCMGAQELEGVIDKLNIDLEKLGYTYEEIIAINNSTMHISFAPFTFSRNSIPSVRFVSTRDSIVSDNLDYMMSQEERDSLDGIQIHRDEAGKLYNRNLEDVTAGSIEVVSGNLVNSTPLFFDEHNFHFVSRDFDWNINEYSQDGVMYKGDNADCISQMIAWSLCRSVENGLQNIKSDEYIPHNFDSGLLDELKSIRSSFSTKELAVNEEYKSENRRKSFEKVRKEKIRELSLQLKSFKPQASMVYSELKSAKNFDEVMIVCEKYDYYYVEELLKNIDFLSDNERKILYTALNRKKLEHKREEYCELSFDDMLNLFKNIISFDKIESLANLMGRIYMSDLLPTLLGLPANEKKYNITEDEVSRILYKLTEEEKFKKNTSKYDQILLALKKLDGDNLNFENIISILEEHDYYGVADLMPQMSSGLNHQQISLIRSVSKLKRQALSEREQFVSFPTFDEMLENINNCNSLGDAVNYMKKYNFVGIEYILPEVVVLTEQEKEDILRYAGKENLINSSSELFE